jgi:hypothetical protein
MGITQEKAIQQARFDADRAYAAAIQNAIANGRRWDKNRPLAREAERTARRLVWLCSQPR